MLLNARPAVTISAGRALKSMFQNTPVVLRDRMNLQMFLKDDDTISERDDDVFKLKAIKSTKQLSKVKEAYPSVLDSVQPLEEDDDVCDIKKNKAIQNITSTRNVVTIC